jgi:hypothetical protein
MIKIKLIGYFLLFLLASCGLPRYLKNRTKIVKAEYSRDTLVIRDFVFCNYLTNSWGITLDKDFFMDEDNVFDIFKTSFSKLNLNHNFISQGKNHCDDYFRDDWRTAITTEAEVKINRMCGDDNKLLLIPVISFRSSHQSGMHFTSGGSVGGSRYTKYEAIFLTVYLVENGSVIFRRTAAFQTSYPAYDIMEIHHVITQKDWDELVALVMKDYMERIR